MFKLTQQQRAGVGAKFREQYEAGATIAALAKETGRSYGWIHQLLTDAGTVMRPRGGGRR